MTDERLRWFEHLLAGRPPLATVTVAVEGAPPQRLAAEELGLALSQAAMFRRVAHHLTAEQLALTLVEAAREA